MKKIITLFMLSIALVISSCKDNDAIVNTPTSTVPKIKIAEAYSESTKIELYSYDTLRVGYNQLYIRILDSASQTIIRDAHLVCTPIMNMGAMQHSCPMEQTPSVQITGDLFPIAAVFTMAGNDMQKWSLTVNFHNHATDKEGTVTLPLTVRQGAFAPQSFVGTDGISMIAAMLPITKPAVGMNNVEFVIYQNVVGEFNPVDELTTEIIPEMPSMGHGSPNNVNPVSKGNGHYAGKVNFIMTGEWKITLTLKRDTIKIGQPFFWITL